MDIASPRDQVDMFNYQFSPRPQSKRKEYLKKSQQIDQEEEDEEYTDIKNNVKRTESFLKNR